MSRSLTVKVPSSRRLLTWVGGIALAVLLLLLGIRLGLAVFTPSPLTSVTAGGDLHQVQVLGGSVYLGRIVNDADGVLRLSRPAILRQDQAPQPSQGQAQASRLVVQSLASDPFDVAADIAIPISQVTVVGVVAPDSGLARAYGQAMGTIPGPSSRPTP